MPETILCALNNSIVMMDRATDALESIRFVSYPINPMLILQDRCYSITSISQVKKLKVRDMSKVPASNDDLP